MYANHIQVEVKFGALWFLLLVQHALNRLQSEDLIR